jgi:transcriptional regulator GlxA family with amidase domain
VKLAAAVSLMEDNVGEPLQISAIADKIGTTQRQLERIFRKYCGQPPQVYYRDVRLRQARALLLRTDKQLMEIAFSTGFGSQSHFSVCYRKKFGLPPGRQRKMLCS